MFSISKISFRVLYSSEVVWPEHTERKSNSREMFLSTQALRHLTPSPSPMDMVEESEQTAHTDEREEEQPIHNVYISLSLLKVN